VADQRPSMSRLPFEIHVGISPGEQLDRSRDVPWDELGVAPMFVGSETASSVAAIQPSIFSGHGAAELDRYLASVAKRSETALIVSMVGSGDGDRRAGSSIWGDQTGVSLPGLTGRINGRRLPDGATAELADELEGVDRDLALRLLGRPPGAPWWALSLGPIVMTNTYGERRYEPGGHLKPLLVNGLGEIVAGVWVPGPERPWRWYVVPSGTDWTGIVAWLADRAIPEYVPGAARRARAAELVDDELLTSGELAARDQLSELERETAIRRDALLETQTAARQEAEASVQVCSTRPAERWSAWFVRSWSSPGSRSRTSTPRRAPVRRTC
jgi:hypothetical protein